MASSSSPSTATAASSAGSGAPDFGESDPGVYHAFSKIMGFARDLNLPIQGPEIVLVGRASSGKSSLLSALLGRDVTTTTSKPFPTKRPIFVHMVNNPSATKPVWTVKRDITTQLEKDTPVDAVKVVEEIQKRNISTTVPLNLQVEFDRCWNITIIDTPALSDNKEMEACILDLCKPLFRILVFVEQAKDWEHVEMQRWARVVDSRVDRSFFVYTQFHNLIKSMQGTRELNAFLTKASPEGKFFFASFGAADQLEALHQTDMDLLEQMQYDLRYERNVGAPTVRRFLIDLTWRKYQEVIPEVLKSLRAFKASSDDSFRRIQVQIGSMDSYKLRAVANNYVLDFLQAVEKLAVGTLEGNPTQNGQTLLEEKTAHAGDWVDASFKPITFDPAKWNISGWDSKLYGGQQIERLLNEFFTLMQHITMTPSTIDEVATAAGPFKLGMLSNMAWTASDIAQKATQRAFKTLIDQLFSRAIYIMERQIGIVDKMLEAKRKLGARKAAAGNQRQATSVSAAVGGGGPGARPMGYPDASSRGGQGAASGGSADDAASDALSNVNDFPYFTNAVKDFYLAFIRETAEKCKQKCMDEFFCTKLIYWEMKDTLAGAPSPATPEDAAKQVNQLATELFDGIKKRIATNVMLKCHNHFLVPISEHLWGEIQAKITCLSDKDMEELFEVGVTRQKLKNDEKQLADVSKRFQEMEVALLKNADIFSRLIYSRQSFVVRS